MSEAAKKRIRWTKELCAEEAKKYPTRRQFQKGCQTAYHKAYVEKWLDDICSHMTSPYKPSGYWTYEKCLEEAKKYKNRWSFQTANSVAYQKAIRMGWIEKICIHMRKNWRTRKELTYEQCKEEAQQYQTRTEFKRKSGGAYNKACKEKWLDEICAHMKQKKMKWTKRECAKIAARFTRRSYFYQENSSAFNAAKRNGWLDEICSHMRKYKSSKK